MTDFASLLHPECAIRPWGYKTEAAAEKCYSENAVLNGGFVAGCIIVILIILWAVGTVSGTTFVVVSSLVAISALFVIPRIAAWFGGQKWKQFDARRSAYVLQGKTPAEAFDLVVREAQAEDQVRATQQVGSNLQYAFSRSRAA